MNTHTPSPNRAQTVEYARAKQVDARRKMQDQQINHCSVRLLIASSKLGRIKARK